jgi:porphobilinogen synthase
MFPTDRPRRLRRHPVLRDLVRETTLTPHDFILPLFVRPGRGIKKEISSMPGNYQLSVDRLVDEVGAAQDLGVKAFIFFGIPEFKDATGSSACRDDGIVQQALRALRPAFPDVLLITDECFCEYTDHGHCGVLRDFAGRLDVDNDATLPLLVRQCISHARAGADMVAPSGMMDGMVQSIRSGLDQAVGADLEVARHRGDFLLDAVAGAHEQRQDQVARRQRCLAHEFADGRMMTQTAGTVRGEHDSFHTVRQTRRRVVEPPGSGRKTIRKRNAT